ncbi:hypothetical protein [Streptomyces scopuliridis]|uniref:hypothetical protein n=1 Tax=Streptomyces scopuliridis TaxID=452529 RepID=UPI001057866B|nr:hypothetical protein [Streptomyces scopuliridis]
MDDGSEGGIPALVAELEGPLDDEHPDVSVTDDESSWSVSAFQSGSLVLENLDSSDVDPRHLPDVSRAEMVRVMTILAQGNLADLQQLEWRPGYE